MSGQGAPETARSARIRGVEHMNGFKSSRKDNELYKHKVNDHRDEEMSFRMEITKSIETLSQDRPMRQ